jgi:CheY-like chemotaxis protein
VLEDLLGADTKWILLVDDEEEIIASVSELLKLTFGEDDLKIVEARNGMDATGKVKNQKFDCIITDMKMPKKEGDALIVSVRQNPFNADTPIIMLTAFPNKKILNDFRFVYLMEKPFLHNELTDLIATQLKVGNSGDRLAADMVNNLVFAAQTFLTTVLKTENFSLESPAAKKSGQELDVEFASQVNLYDNGIHNSFSLLVNKEDLIKLSEKMNSLKDTPLERIGYALGQSILKHAIKGMKKSSSINFNLYMMEGEEAKKNLQPKKGIIIPMECEGIHLRILASGEKKKARAA